METKLKDKLDKGGKCAKIKVNEGKENNSQNGQTQEEMKGKAVVRASLEKLKNSSQITKLQKSKS